MVLPIFLLSKNLYTLVDTRCIKTQQKKSDESCGSITLFENHKKDMQEKGLEPSWYCYHTDLNRARLPIPPFLQHA